MLEINLLNWREVARQQKRHAQHRGFVVGLMLVISLLVMLHFGLGKWREHERVQVNYLQQVLAKQAKSIQAIQATSLAYKKIQTAHIFLEKNLLYRAGVLEFMHQLLQATPHDIIFSELKVSSRQIDLFGTGSSSLDLATLINKLDTGKRVAPQIIALKKSLSTAQLNFQLQVVSDEKTRISNTD